MKIPCIEEKCITWPVCRTSEVITCYKLNKFCCYIDESLGEHGQIFKTLNTHFPNLHTVLGAAQEPAHIDAERALVRALQSRRRQ